MTSSSCLSGGGTKIPFHLDLLHSFTRSPSSSSLTSSTISDSTNSPLLSVSTRKPRSSTPRKRPNQTYYEASVLLSNAFPNVFTSSPLLNHMPPPHHSSQLFLLDHESPFLIHHPTQEHNLLPFLKDTRLSTSSCQTLDDGDIQSKPAPHLHDQYEDDFDTESMLDEELEVGIIDSIMGEKICNEADKSEPGDSKALQLGPSSGWGRRSPVDLVGLGGRLGLLYHGIRKARGGGGWRDVAGQVNWCNFRTVDVNEISPKLNPDPSASSKNNSAAAAKKKRKAEKAQRAADASRNRNRNRGRMELGSPATLRLGLGVKKMLKLDYNNVLEAWTGRGRGSPFPDDTPASDVAVSK